MPRRRKHRHVIPMNLRKKCEDTQSVKDVNHRHITIPANFTSPKKEGVVIKNYHTTEGAEEAHGETTFVNHYDEEQFIR